MTAKRTDSELEESMALQMRAVGLPEPVREYRFHPPRRWRFDFAWPDRMLALEVEGATWARGRHTRGGGFAADVEKYNQATLDGWRVLRVTGEMVKSGDALGLMERAIGAVEYRTTGGCERGEHGDGLGAHRARAGAGVRGAGGGDRGAQG